MFLIKGIPRFVKNNFSKRCYNILLKMSEKRISGKEVNKNHGNWVKLENEIIKESILKVDTNNDIKNH